MRNLLLALRMEVNALDAARNLIEADVVKALKARTVDGPHPVVRDQEVFFPTHEEMLLLHPIFRNELGPRRVFREGLVCRESTPVLPVHLLVGAPFRMLCDKSVLAADYLAFEEGGETGVIFRQPYMALVARRTGRSRVACTFDAEVSAQE